MDIRTVTDAIRYVGWMITHWHSLKTSTPSSLWE